jgi:hypothetical protein
MATFEFNGFSELMFLKFIHVIMCIISSFAFIEYLWSYGYTNIYLYISLLLDISVFSCNCLLWTRLLWTLLYGSLCKDMSSFLLSAWLRVKFTGHVKVSGCFPRWLNHLTCVSALYEFQLVHILTNICYCHSNQFIFITLWF